jgi:hypothetical protein
MKTPLKSLSSGRRTVNILIILLTLVSVLFIADMADKYYSSRLPQKIVVYGEDSGDLITSPIVDPVNYRDIVETWVTWAARCILERNELGLKNEHVIPLLFDAISSRQVHDDWSKLKTQYAQKNMDSEVSVKSINAQPVSKGKIKARVVAEVVLDGTVNNEAIRDPHLITLDITMGRNPDLGRNKMYPLIVSTYAYISDEQLSDGLAEQK